MSSLNPVAVDSRDARPHFLRLNAADNVLVAVTELAEKTPIEGVLTRQLIPAGHKLASKAIAAGEPVRKFGQIIGFAQGDIQPGEHVHEHNCAYAEFSRDLQFGSDYRPTDFVPAAERATSSATPPTSARSCTRPIRRSRSYELQPPTPP